LSEQPGGDSPSPPFGGDRRTSAKGFIPIPIVLKEDNQNPTMAFSWKAPIEMSGSYPFCLSLISISAIGISTSKLAQMTRWMSLKSESRSRLVCTPVLLSKEDPSCDPEWLFEFAGGLKVAMANAGDMPTGPVISVGIECSGKDCNVLGGIRRFIVLAAPLITYRQPTVKVSQKKWIVILTLITY